MSPFVRRVLAILACGVTLAPLAAQAQQQMYSYCFVENDNINVFVGDLSTGFEAYAAGRPGNTLYYQRVGDTNRYVGETGAIYTLFENGRATWTDGSQIIELYYCSG